MRTLPPALRASLDAGVTTLCWCWRITRKDNVVLGLTDHDRDLIINGVTFHAGSGEVDGAPDLASGFGPGDAAVAGRLSSPLITESDIAAGRYDGAVVEILRVDWSETADHFAVWRGRLGEIRRGEAGFVAELRGVLAQLERAIGRTIQRRCDAEVGDARCGVELTAAQFQASGVVTRLDGETGVGVSGLESFTPGWFSGGVLTWTSGTLAGLIRRVEDHSQTAAGSVLRLSAVATASPTINDAFTITAGCDKRWATCKAKFANVINFRGFPMLPGDDWALAAPTSGDINDGSSLWTDRSR